jgi:hypothetical protein
MPVKGVIEDAVVVFLFRKNGNSVLVTLSGNLTI